MTNVTLCFSPAQALLAAKAGATFISPFVGRLDDIGHSGMSLIADIKRIYTNYRFPTQILVASVRSVNHILEAASIGADVATLPPAIVWQLAKHNLTDKGLQDFMNDWAKTGRRYNLLASLSRPSAAVSFLRAGRLGLADARFLYF